VRILIACEFSGHVRNAFAAKGHDVWSCDLLSSKSPGNHIQGNALDFLDDNWDLMIAHPPCQYLSLAGIKYWSIPERQVKQQLAFDFFIRLYQAPINKICIENPVGYINQHFRKPDQIIHPWYFGERKMKRTCLWLRGLPKLFWIKESTLFDKQTTTIKPSPIYIRQRGKTAGKKIHWTEACPGGKDRSQIRSITSPAIAKAMAEQWG